MIRPTTVVNVRRKGWPASSHGSYRRVLPVTAQLDSPLNAVPAPSRGDRVRRRSATHGDHGDNGAITCQRSQNDAIGTDLRGAPSPEEHDEYIIGGGALTVALGAEGNYDEVEVTTDVRPTCNSTSRSRSSAPTPTTTPTATEIPQRVNRWGLCAPICSRVRRGSESAGSQHQGSLAPRGRHGLVPTAHGAAVCHGVRRCAMAARMMPAAMPTAVQTAKDPVAAPIATPTAAPMATPVPMFSALLFTMPVYLRVGSRSDSKSRRPVGPASVEALTRIQVRRSSRTASDSASRRGGTGRRRDRRSWRSRVLARAVGRAGHACRRASW